jgi:putative membrane-bound dehydrogenase-like protein
MNVPRWFAAFGMVAAIALLGSANAAGSPGAAEQPGPLSPAASLACFDVVPGHVVELVAAEPLVFDPVAICWDDDGRLFVAEMSDYPNGDGGGRIVTLTDTDGDGTIDTRTIFAAGLPFPNGLLAWNGGLLVTAAPDILHLVDRDGDGAAESSEVILTGFQAGNQQLRVNGLCAGPDGWVYAANGRSGGSIASPKRPDAPAVSIDRHDLRFRPDTGEVEAVAGFSQFGLAFDAQGNRFSNWNTAPIRQVVFPLDVASRHPLSAPPSDMEVLEDPSQQNRLFPISGTPTTFNREPTDAFNASCGLSIDRGSRLAPCGCAYVCEPLLNLVHRRELVPAGVAFEARRPAGEETREFLASRDPWFRPVFTVTGPDGALWICDFYRRWVEHPDFVRAELRGGVVWDEGKDRGRIWRVRPADDAPRRGDGVGAEPVAGMAAARVAARQRLDGAGEELAAVALALAADPDPAIRFDVALAVESLPAETRGPVLAKVIATAPTDRWVERAVLCVAEDGAAEVVRWLVAGDQRDGTPPRILRGLAEACGRVDAGGDSAPLSSVVATSSLDRAEQLALLAGWVEGRRLAGVADIPADFGGRTLDAWLAVARDLAAGAERDDCGDALALLHLDHSLEALSILLGRLALPIGVEEAALLFRSLRGRDPIAVSDGVLAAWPAASPAVRRAMLEALSTPSMAAVGLSRLAAALDSGDVGPGDIDPEARRTILTGDSIPDGIRTRLEALLGGVASADREGVVASIEAALPEEGDRHRGRDLFVRHCSGCHRSGGVGTRVGPDLAGMQSKTREQLLEDILDPNRRLTGEYSAVSVVTKDGEAFSGLVSGETPSAVQLTLAEGKVATIPRGAIEVIRGTGRSLMPEGFEQALSPGAFADVIEFLRRGP